MSNSFKIFWDGRNIDIQIKTTSIGAEAFVLDVLCIAENLIRVEELPLKTENPWPS